MTFPGVAQAEPTAAGWLGVVLDSAPGPGGGVLIRRVLPGGPALEAGLGPGDEVLHLGATLLEDAEHLVRLVGELGAGASVALDVRGRSEHVTVRLGARPPRETDWAGRMVGERVPELTLPDLYGQPVPVFRAGSIHVLEFWATWCGPCHAAQPMVRALRRAWPEATVRMVLVSEEDAEVQQGFFGEGRPPGEATVDTDRALHDALWVDSYPIWYVVDPLGRIRAVRRGLVGARQLRSDIAAMEAEFSAD
jgi:thiol-disulfide isomerase/thioredoxin